jgi:hypothetical protein
MNVQIAGARIGEWEPDRILQFRAFAELETDRHGVGRLGFGETDATRARSIAARLALLIPHPGA